MATTKLTVVKTKFITQAYATWWNTASFIHVSVMHEDGTPVKDLEKINFKVGLNSGIWQVLTIGSFAVGAIDEGYYLLGVADEFVPDRIYTVEVTKTLVGLPKYRGQSLAAMQTKVLP